ncbi:MAG: hypothetical protein ACYDDD_09260 [Acidithiobacillus ferrivorans]
MANRCEDKSCEMDAMRDSHGRVLWIVLAINAVMFFVGNRPSNPPFQTF